MEIVEGEEISQDEASSPGWMMAYGRKNSKKMRTVTTTRERNAPQRVADERVVAAPPPHGTRTNAWSPPRGSLNVRGTRIASTACKDRFQILYIVRRRRCQRHRRSEKTHMALGMQSRDSSVSPSVSGTPKRGHSVTPAAQRRKRRSRSRGRSASRRRIQEELTWADRVKEKTLKPKRVEGTNMADDGVHKSMQEPKVEVNKAKRKAPAPKDESDSEMQVESSQNKMLEELLRISKENQLSVNQLVLHMGALESKVGAIENKELDRVGWW
ncbi:hypothetical protein HPB51_019030 [Rhipicephalus microplus]|uniref:Uncharacterized protein n=1 Tax=Rhipicephalus microplus TaxID=6941 RepID=A0A9J6D7D0_RHIMP|nr:hypothetical protein HPB51_019030 [Rhipicephalus microplus]